MVSDPNSPTAAAFMELGAAVVREVAKLDAAPRSAVRWAESRSTQATSAVECANICCNSDVNCRLLCSFLSLSRIKWFTELLVCVLAFVVT